MCIRDRVTLQQFKEIEASDYVENGGQLSLYNVYNKAVSYTHLDVYKRQDVYGANGIDWKDAISTRAQVTYNSGNRQNQNNEIIHCYTVTFTIRLYHKVNEQMRIIWNGNKYRILSINRELYKQSITIVTELINE